METTTLNINPELFWGLIALTCVVALTIFISWLYTLDQKVSRKSGTSLRATFGLPELNRTVFLFACLIWSGIALSLVSGLFWMVWKVILSIQPAEGKETWDWRFLLAQLVALTGVLGAVIAFPVSLVRMRLTRDQNLTLEEQKRIAEEALFNDKLKAAADDLHARRDIHEKAAPDETVGRVFIEDDIMRRVAAIDRLEGLAEERPSEAPRITRLLCVYLRQMSKGIDPDHAEHPRADMEAAAQSIGRMKLIPNVNAAAIKIDLSEANLSNYDLSNLCFDEALLRETSLVETNLRKTQFRNARFYNCTLLPANMQKAKLHGARFSEVKVKVPGIGQSYYAERLLEARLRGASFRNTQLRLGILIQLAQRPVFLDSTMLQKSENGFDVYEFIAESNLSLEEFKIKISEELNLPVFDNWQESYRAWRAWQKEIGFDPEDPSTW